MEIQLKAIEAQGDAFGGKERRELIHFKRLKIDGIVHDGEASGPFTAILDQRARLFHVRTPENSICSSWRIGSAIIHEMGLYLPRPVGHFLMEVQTEDEDANLRFAEWMVLDVDHIGGLLHRIRERKRFSEREAPPVPSRLTELRHELVASVLRNVGRATRTLDGDGNLRRDVVLQFEHSVWAAHRERFMELAEDHAERSIFAAFFDLVEQFERLWSVAIEGKGDRPDNTAPPEGWKVALSPSARSELRKTFRQMDGLGKAIHERYGTGDEEITSAGLADL